MGLRMEARGRVLSLVVAVTGLFLLLSGGVASADPGVSLDRDRYDIPVHNTLSDLAPGYLFTLRSTGTEDLIVEEAWLEQDADRPFTLHTGWCDRPLPPGMFCELGGYLDFSRAGSWEATLAIKTNASSEPLRAVITGTVEITTVEFDQKSFDFGAAQTGLMSGGPEQTFKVKASGSRPFVPRAHIQGRDSESFRIVANGCQELVAPGNTCEVTVAFRPAGSEPGGREARLISGGGMIPKNVRLFGTAEARQPANTTLSLNAPKRVRTGKALRLRTTVSNSGGMDASAVTVRILGPKRLLRGGSQRATYPALGPESSASIDFRVGVRRRAAGRKVTLRLVATQDGQRIWSRKHVVRVLPGR